MIKFVAGVKPPHPEETHPRLHLGANAAPTLPAPPDQVDWHTSIFDWPLYGNATWGDCVEAEIGHHEEVFSTYGGGRLVEVSDSDVIDAYTALTGFDPNAGPPGNNPTDQGTNIQDALGYWLRTGIAGHRIDAFASVDVANLDLVKNAVALLGSLSIGINLPQSAEDQFNAGHAWDVVADDGGILGGHCVAIVGYDASGLYAVTWGKVQRLTYAFWRTYVEEAWSPISREWVNAMGVDPEGVGLYGLGQDFAELTGQPNPFPQPPPPVPVPPSPIPAPPVPVPGPDAADETLAAAARGWLEHHHIGDNAKFAKAVAAWLAAKDLAAEPALED